MQAVRKYYEALHQIPECSGAERETAAYVSDVLVSLGYALQQYPCGGVSADLVRAPEAPWIVFRADMDALPVTEEAPVAFASRYPGVMHACGHDAHMAMLLAAAGALAGKTLPQNVRFLFQPAEETTQGAARMLQEGALPKAEAIFGMHVWPGVPLGTLAARPGAQMASSDVFRVQFSGRSVHCARRSLGCDALEAAVAMAAGLPELEKLAENDGSILFLAFCMAARAIISCRTAHRFTGRSALTPSSTGGRSAARWTHLRSNVRRRRARRRPFAGKAAARRSSTMPVWSARLARCCPI